MTSSSLGHSKTRSILCTPIIRVGENFLRVCKGSLQKRNASQLHYLLSLVEVGHKQIVNEVHTKEAMALGGEAGKGLLIFI